MKYTFNDINNKDFYDTCCVAFVCGNYHIFNNMVVDQLKDLCDSKENVDIAPGLAKEFQLNTLNQVNTNVVNIDMFMDVINIPNIDGKWFCSIDLGTATKKQIEKIENYIKHPSNNGILVVTSDEYKQFRRYLMNKLLINSRTCHIIQLSFPNRTTLTEIVKKQFSLRKVSISDQSAQYFIIRMSTSYDEYDRVIDKICTGVQEDTQLSYERIQEELKGIENYVLDDFIVALAKPIASDKISTNRHVYKMLKVLIQEYGAKGLVNKLQYSIDELIQFRIIINSGIVPIKVSYSFMEVKNKLGEDNKLSKISEFRFRKMAQLASLISIRDLVYVQLILNNIDTIAVNKSERKETDKETGKERVVTVVTKILSEESCEKALYSMLHRSVLNKDRLDNDIGISDVTSYEIDNIDKIKYDEEHLLNKLELKE